MSLFVDTDQIDPTKDYYPELVGEGKKYKTNVDAARAIMEKDLFIKRMTSEAQELRNSLAERVKLEELTERLSKLAKSPGSDSEQQTTNGTNTTVVTPSITPEQIDELLDKRLAEKEKQRSEASNLQSVTQKLIQKFGTNYSSRLNDEAGKLGMTPQQLEQVAATNPAAFLRLVGAEDTKQTNTLFNPPKGTESTFTPKSGERTASWYKELKKTDPIRYASREITIQKHNDAQRIGEAFFDVDE